jgi:peptidoglycan/xylan/chitin deacetylase (PgdA/CDA1 family)
MKRFIKDSIIKTIQIPAVANIFNHLHKRNVVFLGYHGISRDNEQYEPWTLVRESDFYAQMAFLRKTFNCLSIDEALEYRNNHIRLSAVVTFDDGYANNLTIALPILEKFGVPAVIYISTGPVLRKELFWPDALWISAQHSQLTDIDLHDVSPCLGRYHLGREKEKRHKAIMRLIEDVKKADHSDREKIVGRIVEKFGHKNGSSIYRILVENSVFTPLTEEQIKILSRHPLITIGAHTHDHELLDRLTGSAAEQSIKKNKLILEEVTGHRIDHFAYPNGNFNKDVMNLVRNIGFKSGLTFKSGLHRSCDDVYAIKRIGIGPAVDIKLFRAMTLGVFDLKWRLSKR